MVLNFYFVGRKKCFGMVRLPEGTQAYRTKGLEQVGGGTGGPRARNVREKGGVGGGFH